MEQIGETIRSMEKWAGILAIPVLLNSKKIEMKGGDNMKPKTQETDYLNELVIFLGSRKYTPKAKRAGEEEKEVSSFTYLNINSGEVGELGVRTELLEDGRGGNTIEFGDENWVFPIFVIIREEKRSRFGSSLNFTQCKNTGKFVQLTDYNSVM